ncbi:hypothetical protein NHF46_11705 [Arthrobacter alpinus]|nr:hypothetical protein [Arthrobacter alpinus]
MPWDGSPKTRHTQTPTRIHSPHLSTEPSLTAFAASCITAAGADHTADPVSVLTAIYNVASAQVGQWFTALNRTHDGETFDALFALDHYTDQYLWDYLTGDGGKIAVHNNLAKFLDSERLKEIITTSIRNGHHNTPSHHQTSQGP